MAFSFFGIQSFFGDTVMSGHCCVMLKDRRFWLQSNGRAAPIVAEC